MTATDIEISEITIEQLDEMFKEEKPCENPNGCDNSPDYNCRLKCCGASFLLCKKCIAVEDKHLSKKSPAKCKLCETPFPCPASVSIICFVVAI